MDKIKLLDTDGSAIEGSEGVNTVGTALSTYFKHHYRASASEIFKWGKDGWTDVGEKVFFGRAGKAAPALDDKAGWIKLIPVGLLPERFRLDDRGHPRKTAFVFIEYLEQRRGVA